MYTRKIEINGETLSFFDSEKGDKSLIFIHGAFINKEYWNEQLLFFKDKYRVIAIDLAGHGGSSQKRTQWTIQSSGKDVSELIDKLLLKNIIMIGHSAGSDIMLETVANNPSQIIGLVEIDHMKNVGVKLPQENIDQLIQGLNADFEKTCEYFARQALLTDQTNTKLVNKLLKDYKVMNPKIGISLLENGFNYTERETQLLDNLELKLNLIHVNYSPTNEVGLKKYLGKNYTLHSMNGTCHYPMLEHPSELNQILKRIFLEIIKY